LASTQLNRETEGFRLRGAYRSDQDYDYLDVVTPDGSSYIARQATTGPCPGDGWLVLALHSHDLRGTAATKFYIPGLSERVIAEIMGWEEETVAKIIRRYVGRSAATKSMIAQLNKARQGT
jgi:hypothetical protein